MKKTICDRCGKEIEKNNILSKAQLNGTSKVFKGLTGIYYELTSRDYCGFINKIYDLCDDCQHDLTDWLNGGREEEK